LFFVGHGFPRFVGRARARGLNNDYKGLGLNVKTCKPLLFQLKKAFFCATAARNPLLIAVVNTSKPLPQKQR
jgi:hypothetical protein